MSDRPEHESMAGQFPDRPTHPDFVKLRAVVDWIEARKMAGASPEEIYAEYIDVASVGYVARNRSGMDAPRTWDLPTDHAGMASWMTASWMEGFLFGVRFEQEGGHSRLHKATPAAPGSFACLWCGEGIKQVPGGSGPVWVHEATGMVPGT